MCRTGSTFLQDALDSHSQVACRNCEVFNPGQAWEQSQLTPQDFLDQVASVEAQAAGCKWLVEGLHNVPKAWDVVQEKQLRLLHCVRPNLLDGFLSLSLAKANNAFTSLYGDYTKTNLVLDPKEARDFFLYSEETTAEIRGETATRQIPRLEVQYEDLASGEAWPSIFAFLEVPPEPVKSVCEKQRTGSQKELIANYDELVAAFAGTRWASFFD
jgi:hypothetical protein